MSEYKAIILAAGRASRLFPITFAVNKQLLAIYDKPMIYYPLSVLMLSQIKDVLIITRKQDLKSFKSLLGNGRKLGMKISYDIQEKPKGIADAFIIGEKFIGKSNCALILGDNIFYGQNFSEKLLSAKSRQDGATIFSYPVHDPQRYGVVEIDKKKKDEKRRTFTGKLKFAPQKKRLSQKHIRDQKKRGLGGGQNFIRLPYY